MNYKLGHFASFLLPVFALLIGTLSCSTVTDTSISTLGEGWARNSINTVIFRKNALTSDSEHQYAAYYNPDGFVVLAKRKIGSSDWKTYKTQYQGNVRDAHNSISIELNGAGYLHVAWDHHNTKLRYAKTLDPSGLELGPEVAMIGTEENVVSYPEFYRANDELFFFYRDGGSGNGNLVINKYEAATGQWQRLQTNLIDGEGQRNAYWQAYVDPKGTIHISWVWRESPDVASNHDMSYAKSTDGGLTWQKSDGTAYELPITQATAEIVQHIPQNSELINQTAMTTNIKGEPYIVSYWRQQGSEVPQFQLIYQDGNKWKTKNLGFRTQTFSLSGMGTKQIPISRPQVLVSNNNQVHVIFRDAERDNKVSVASNSHPFSEAWQIKDYSENGYNAWEPTLDPHLWKSQQQLSLLLQKNTQVDGEGLSERASAPVQVLDLRLE